MTTNEVDLMRSRLLASYHSSEAEAMDLLPEEVWKCNSHLLGDILVDLPGVLFALTFLECSDERMQWIVEHLAVDTLDGKHYIDGERILSERSYHVGKLRLWQNLHPRMFPLIVEWLRFVHENCEWEGDWRDDLSVARDYWEFRLKGSESA